ncbi:hypothetical protein D3C75_1200310 [compost metagenome]
MARALLENPTNNIAVETPVAILNVLNNVFAIIKCPMHLKVFLDMTPIMRCN